MATGQNKSSLRKKLAVTAVASVISLLACELVLRLFFDVPISPFIREYDEDLGVRYKKNLDATLTYPEFTMKWSTNSRGFRGPRPAPSSKGCILILGDSYSEGWGVSNGEEYASLLREDLDSRYGPGVVPVINAAMSASGQGRWIKLLRTTLVEFEPRLVLFQTCWNDALDNLAERQYELVDCRFMLSSSFTRSEVVERAEQPKGFVRRIQPVLEAVPGLEHSHLFALIRNSLRRVSHHPAWRLDQDEPDSRMRRELRPEVRRNLYEADLLFLALVEHSLAICHRRGWPTALMSVRMGGSRLEKLQRLCERFATPLLDIRNREAHPEFYYEVDSHWNQAGHREVARMILEQLLATDSEPLRGLTPIK